MRFDDFADRWRRMEEETGIAYRPSWARLPGGEFEFLRPDELLFLRESGLPQNAPCFSFGEVAGGMPRVDEVYGPRDEKLWARVGRDKVAAFRMLGQDGGGNPLALHIESREIWMLDHEGAFKPYSLVNSGLAQLAESLLLFARAESQQAESEIEVLQKQLALIDGRAAQQGAFWHGYAEDFNDFI